MGELTGDDKHRDRPRVSIGVPVFNGERYIGEAIESLLEQTYDDFEVIVCDNDSTDGTGVICQELAGQDARIRYIRNEQNVGAAGNFNKTFELAKGEYFKWAAHDDLCEKGYLQACVNVLDENPGVVLCHSRVSIIDEQGRVIRHHADEIDDTQSDDVGARFFAAAALQHWCFDVFGLIRRQALADTPLIGAYYGSDRNLLVDLALKGKFYRVPEYLFLSRDHGERSIRQSGGAKARTTWFDTKRKPRATRPYWKHFWEYFKSIGRANLSVRQKCNCFVQLAKWMKRNRQKLKRDLSGEGRLSHEKASVG